MIHLETHLESKSSEQNRFVCNQTLWIPN
ncbi:protein of unknown function (plasmid) [Aminobacter niigataensis]|nr:protein of unknown function [Aminobacter niigataensis]